MDGTRLTEAKSNRNTEFVVVDLYDDLLDQSGADPITAVSLSCRDDLCEPLTLKARFN